MEMHTFGNCEWASRKLRSTSVANNFLHITHKAVKKTNLHTSILNILATKSLDINGGKMEPSAVKYSYIYHLDPFISTMCNGN